jgi:alkylated DNA repair protein alkB family protein 8
VTSCLFARGTIVELKVIFVHFSINPSRIEMSERNEIGALSETGSERRSDLTELSDREASRLESDHVHAVYELIADHFSHTRHTAWPKVAAFVGSLTCTDRLLDVGCGNGKNLLLPVGLDESEGEPPSFGLLSCLRTATDMSFGLLSVCKERGLQSVQANGLHLPFQDESFDAVLCIAVLHHLASERRRCQALQQIERVLRSSGKALIYVWAFEQKRNGQSSVYIASKNESDGPEVQSPPTGKHQSTAVGDLPIHRNRTPFQQQDMLVPWNMKKLPKKSDREECKKEDSESPDEQLRYYHLFKEGELKALIQQSTDLMVTDDYFDNGNWAVLLRKK